VARRGGFIGPKRSSYGGGIWSLYDVQQEVSTSTWGGSLLPFSNIVSTSLPHSGINTTEAGSTAITSFGTAAMSQTSTATFGGHDGHDGGPADWVAYLAVYVGGSVGKVAVNQLKICIHANCFGNFVLQGSNNASTSGVFYNTGSWSDLPFTPKYSSHMMQNAGGTSSGLSERQVLVFNYNNDVGYTHYRLLILDSNLPSETPGTEMSGWAAYNWELLRVTNPTTSFRYWRYVVGSAVVNHHPRVSRIIAVLDGVDTNINVFVGDNCSDSGTIPSGAQASYDAGSAKTATFAKIYSTYGGGLRSSNYQLQGSNDNSNWVNVLGGVMSNNTACGLQNGTIDF